MSSDACNNVREAEKQCTDDNPVLYSTFYTTKKRLEFPKCWDLIHLGFQFNLTYLALLPLTKIPAVSLPRNDFKTCLSMPAMILTVALGNFCDLSLMGHYQ